jgi:hypothetical protein
MCFSHLWVSVKGLGSVFAFKFGIDLEGGCHSSVGHILNTVWREHTSQICLSSRADTAMPCVSAVYELGLY